MNPPSLRLNKPIEEILKEIKARVFSFSFKVCGHAQDAEDMAQETLVKAYKHLPKLNFKNSRAFNVWLYKVAKNACMMHRRKEKKVVRDLPIEEIPELENHNLVHGDFVLDEILDKEEEKRIRTALLKLPLPYRIALILRDLEDLSSRETAEILKIKEGTVRIRLYRARQLLKKELDRQPVLSRKSV